VNQSFLLFYFHSFRWFFSWGMERGALEEVKKKYFIRDIIGSVTTPSFLPSFPFPREKERERERDASSHAPHSPSNVLCCSGCVRSTFPRAIFRTRKFPSMATSSTRWPSSIRHAPWILSAPPGVVAHTSVSRPVGVLVKVSLYVVC